MTRPPARFSWVWIAAAAIPLALPSPALGMCAGPEPQPFKATIEACRSPEPEIRTSVERYRNFYETRMAAGRSFEGMVEDRLTRPEVIVTLRVKQSRGLPWRKAAPPEPWEALLRLESGGCESVPLHRTLELIRDFTCCDVRPSNDNACLIDLPAVERVPQK